MRKLSIERRAEIVSALVEGNSIRSICRMTGTAKRTITRLLVELGAACYEYQSRVFQNLNCQRVQVDEIWSFIACKEKNVTAETAPQRIVGDAWVWVGIDADTKLVPCWLVGKRDTGCATEFITDLASRLAHRVQLTTDGHKTYLTAVADAFGSDVDYAIIIKTFGVENTGEARYSPAKFVSTKKLAVTGDPDMKHVSTSYIERQNLTMRMGMRRFTRLTNGFSKKTENHEAAVALHYMHYNFVRIHQTLRVTPAMEAGVTNHLWSVEEMVGLLDSQDAARAA